MIEIAEDLFAAVQDVRFMGLLMPARMTVIRDGGALVVISPFAPTPELTAALDALGRVENVIAPNLFHHLFAGEFKAHYTKAKLWAPVGLSDKRPDLEVDAEFAERGQVGPLEYLSCSAFGMRTLSGKKAFGETVFFHAHSRTLIVTDCAFHFDDSCKAPLKMLARATGSYKKLAPSLVERLGVIDRAAARATVDEILQWDFTRVVVAHGGVVEDDAKQRFADGFAWLGV